MIQMYGGGLQITDLRGVIKILQTLRIYRVQILLNLPIYRLQMVGLFMICRLRNYR
jgi:hypothetical protein